MRNYEEIFKGLKGISKGELENRMSEIEKVKMQKFELSGRATSEEGLNRDIKNLEAYFSQYDENVPEEEKGKYEKAKERYEELKAAKERLDAGKVDYEKSTYPEYDSFSIKDCKKEEKRLAVWGKIREPMEEEWDKVSSRRSELDEKLAEVENEYNAAKEIEDKHQALENELKELEEYFAKYEKTMLDNNYQENKELFDKTIYKEKQARYKEIEEERKALPVSNFKAVSEKTNKLKEEYNAQDLALREDEDKIENKVAFFTDENNWETVMQMSDGDIREKITGKREKTVYIPTRNENYSETTVVPKAREEVKKEEKAEKEEKVEEASLTNRYEDKHPILAKIPFLTKIANRFMERRDERKRTIREYYEKYADAYLKKPGLLQKFAIRYFPPMRSKIERRIDEIISETPSGITLDEDFEESGDLKEGVTVGELKQSTIDPNSRAGKRLMLNKELKVGEYNPVISNEEQSEETEIIEEER